MGEKKRKTCNKKPGLGCLQLVSCVAAQFLSLWLKSCHLLAPPVNGAAFQASLAFVSIQACCRDLTAADLIIHTSADTRRHIQYRTSEDTLKMWGTEGAYHIFLYKTLPFCSSEEAWSICPPTYISPRLPASAVYTSLPQSHQSLDVPECFLWPGTGGLEVSPHHCIVCFPWRPQ